MMLKLYCTCGAFQKGWLPLFAAEEVRKQWENGHSGPGHAPCDACAAARARAKAEQSHADDCRKERD